MSVSQDLLQAKQLLSARLLRYGMRGNAISMRYSINVHDVVASAGNNVHAVGVGRKIVEGKTTETPAVRIYVTQKVAKSLISPRDLLPEVIDGIPTDIIESPPAFLMPKRKAEAKKAEVSSPPNCSANKRNRQRPIIAGSSTAHFGITAGTIAYFCRSTRHGDDPNQVFLLSNNHVFADVNKGRIGDDIYQPGPADGGMVSDHVAELHRFVQIQLSETTPNRVDAAIARLLPGIEFLPEMCQIGKIKGTSQGVEGLVVCKHGRTTGYTEGIIADESVDAIVGMDHNNPNIAAVFQNQMRIERLPSFAAIGLGGDSGSLVVNKSNKSAVGLYFAGPQSGSYGIANHISDVLSELQIELL